MAGSQVPEKIFRPRWDVRAAAPAEATPNATEAV